jgi:N-acetylglucosamine-6-phosphate deacetylase
MKTLIHNGTLITPTERTGDGWLLAEGGKIAALGRGAPPGADRRIDAAGRFIAPGFFDLHAQGFRGHDLWDPSDENFLAATREMARTGVTAAQASVDAMPDVCQVMRPRIGRSDGGARIVGLYFETPFIAPTKRGAIPLARLRPPSPEAAREIIEWSRGILSMITIAPELAGALDLVRLFRRTAGTMGPVVAAVGHTAATFAQAAAGIEAGMTHCTHLYNAMPAMLHREPGAVGALLAHPGASVEIICDGVHLHPAAVHVAVACKGVPRTCLITDCVSGLRVETGSGAPRLPDGTLAGSMLSMDRAVANVQRFAGVTLEQAVEMATLTPARAAGCDRARGSLAPGKAADVVLFDEGVNVSLTMIGGEVVFGGKPGS